MTKKLLIVAVALLLIGGCKKDTQKDPIPDDPKPVDPKPISYSDKIILDTVHSVNGNIKLSWTKLDNSKFLYYTVLRKDYPDFEEIRIAEISDKETVTFTDTDVPYSSKVSYRVTGDWAPTSYVLSNTVDYNRKGVISINARPHDVLYNSADKLLYFFVNDFTGNTISVCDIRKQTINTIETIGSMGIGDLGVFNNKKELYVSASQMVYVYDALTLNEITAIDIGTSAASLAFSNGNLFISTSNNDGPNGLKSLLKVFSRASGKKISEAPGIAVSRVKKIPGSSTELINIPIYSMERSYYKFDNNGLFVSSDLNPPTGDYYFDANIFEFFPDGSKYLSSENGYVFNRDMSYQTRLTPVGTKFTSFAFNTEDKLLYAATSSKKIEVFSLNDLKHIKTIATRAYPHKIFYDDSKIISVSKADHYDINPYQIYPSKLVVEILNK